jgi:hypothetical protein
MARSVVVLLLFVFLFSGTAFAQDRGFGLGIIIGDPTGLSAKGWVGSDSAIAGAAAWSVGDKDSFQLHADYLYHRFDLFPVEIGKLPLYYGIGGRVRLEDPDNRIGIRIPFGITYIFEKDPLDIFFEVVPLMDLAPETDFDLNAGIGIRYWFR